MLSPGIHPGCQRLDFFARHALEWAILDRQSVKPSCWLSWEQLRCLSSQCAGVSARDGDSGKELETLDLFFLEEHKLLIHYKENVCIKMDLGTSGLQTGGPSPAHSPVCPHQHTHAQVGQCFKEKVAVVPAKLKGRGFIFLELCRFRRQDSCETATDQARRAELQLMSDYQR